MTTMLECAARSLHASISHTGTWEKLTESAREHYVKHARAVLMAVREPDETTRWSMAEQLTGETIHDTHFTAMIDAILAEKA